MVNPRTRIDMNFNSLVMNVSPASIMIILHSYNTFMENFQQAAIDLGGGVEGGEKPEVNEDKSLWKTTDVKDEEFWFLKVEEGKSWKEASTVYKDYSLWKTTVVTDEEIWFLKGK